MWHKGVSGLAGAVGDVLVLRRFVLALLAFVVRSGDLHAIVDSQLGADVEGVRGVQVLGYRVLVHDAVRGDLPKHFERVEPGLDGLQADGIVDLSNCDSFNVDRSAVSFGCDFLSLAVETLARRLVHG